MRTCFSHLPDCGRRGTVAVEYAVIVGTLSGAIVASFYGLGGKLITLLTNLPI